MKKKKAAKKKASPEEKKRKQEGFFQDVWEVVKLIPRGKVTSYGAIAKYLGTGKSARMVGWAMNASPSDVPAHRVLNSKGLLTGKHHFPEGMMEKKLNAEGHKISGEQLVNFEMSFWDPNFEIEI